MVITEDDNVYIWGCGHDFNKCERFLRLQKVHINSAIDSDTSIIGTEIRGVPIIPPSDLKEYRAGRRVIVSTSKYYDEIKNILEEFGYKENIEFVSYNSYVDQFMANKRIISLGYNCEISQRLNDYSLVDSYPFSWAFIENREFLPKIVEEPEMLLRDGSTLLSNGMFRDRLTGVRLHSHIHQDQLFDKNGNPREDMIKDALDELSDRLGYLNKKYNDLCGFEGKLFFVGKYESDSGIDDELFFKEIFETLKRKFHNAEVNLFIVREKRYLEDDINMEVPSQIQIRYVERYADDAHTDTDGDFEGWYRIIRELVFEC